MYCFIFVVDCQGRGKGYRADCIAFFAVIVRLSLVSVSLESKYNIGVSAAPSSAAEKKGTMTMAI
jgi:hypothetical protein